MGKKKNSYSFLVHEGEDMDAIRVAKEVREDKPDSIGFILILDNNNAMGDGTATCLYQDFLNKFNGEDAPLVLGEELSPCWGLDSLPKLNKKDKLLVFSQDNPQTFRVMLCGKSDIDLVRKEIDKAKEVLNNIQITVKIL